MKHYRDHYFQKAKQEAYPARSVYKLKEMQKKFSLLQTGNAVLDLGAAPGSWTLFAAQQVGKQGRVLAVDRQAVDRDWPEQVRFVQGDLLRPDAVLSQALAAWAPFDVLISDMAPRTTGIKLRDQTLSFELAQGAFDCCAGNLARGGRFVTKIFEGPDVPELIAAMRKRFARVKGFTPKSSRDESKETFLLGFGYRG
ncbi:MAG: RlmE family RNA methyltransferase [Desulfohalobiaceae bacterium]|nr:RlmE family RNA methyltransferase [Desulfohalobiaceae bacterium]